MGLLTERSIFRFSYGSHIGKLSSWYMDKYKIPQGILQIKNPSDKHKIAVTETRFLKKYLKYF